MANKTYLKLKEMVGKGVKKVKLYYTREVNGKRIPNYKTIGISAGVLAAAAAGVYAIRKHKKHGVVVTKVK